MHRSIRSARLGVLATLLMLGTSQVGCVEDGSEGAADSQGPTNVFDASGGAATSTGGRGGIGGTLSLQISDGGGGSIEVRETGSVDASFEPTAAFTPELGANALIVSSDLTIPIVSSAPPLDQPYLLEGNSSLYVSDGDAVTGDEAPVTGLQVDEGATLTLELNVQSEGSLVPDTGGLNFANDLVNDGTITVTDVEPARRGNIELSTDSDYIGGGRIETFGAVPGQNGGRITVIAFGDAYNSGAWLSYGADRSNGHAGNGGDIAFRTFDFEFTIDDLIVFPGGSIENTGRMDASGGAASGASGSGGFGGWIYVAAYLSLWNSGDLDSIGGDGVEAGGAGGDVDLEALFVGELRNTADLEAYGGRAADGMGGRGGYMSAGAWGGDVRSSGVMFAQGGDAQGLNSVGGAGGEFYFFTVEGGNELEDVDLDIPAGDIWISGGILATAGDAPERNGSGGDGGLISVYLANGLDKGTQSIHILGIGGLRTDGGEGQLVGGHTSGDISDLHIDLASQPEEGPVVATGSVVVEPPMSVSGGDADPDVAGSKGGRGGEVEINAGTISYSTAVAEGGTGETPGADGTVTPETLVP